MTSFLKNLKSTLLDSSGNNKKMPSRHTPNEDPFKRINSWDDGYEYINGGDRSMGGNPGPMYSPPPPKPTRRSTYEPDHRRERHTYPTPPESDDDTPRRHRRGARRSPSPPRRRESRREPDRYHDEAPRSRRPNLDSHYTAPPPRARDSPRSYSRSPSPPPRARRNEHHDARHYDTRSRSPPRRKPSTRDRDRDHHDRDPHHRSGPRSSGSGSGNDRKYPPRAGDKRPPISRSKTTSAADNAKKGVAGLSPQWKKAAQAAFTAGSAAAMQMRSQPGAWKGEKGAKVATAALGAAAMDILLKKNAGGGGDDRDRERDRSRERDRERDRERGGGNRRRSEVEVLGGFVGDFLTDQFNKRTSGRR
ncbi:hypothetical protein V8F20_011520 [Naviculisporaceae sp. PSN 640]